MPHNTLSPRRAAILLALSAALAACALLSPGVEKPTPTPASIAPAAAVTESPPTPGTGVQPTAPTASPSPVPLSLAFVARVSSARPGSIAALSLQGAQVAASAHSAQLDVVDVDLLNPDDPAGAVRQAAARSPAVVIVAGAGLSEATRTVAAEFPSIPFVGIDQPTISPVSNCFVVGDPGNRLDEEGFLAGMLAGLV